MPLTTGTRLGPYEITGSVGAGGMGEVYRARDTRLDRTVAVKVLPTGLAADPVFRDRFEREARTLSGLTHPNICTVFDVGRHDGTDYLVMEFLEGRTLANMLERGPLPAGDALRLARQVADALAAAHRLGIIHRDLKPANVMVVRGGAVKLLDFGLAKRAAIVAGAPSDATATAGRTQAALTGTGTILGTFQYMAPEQIEGREADARADVWAFGCLLYELLTGRRAFQAATQASLIAAILERQPVPVQLPDSSLTPALNRIIGACLEKDPDERFQSIRDVARELDWMTQALPAAPPASASRRPVLLTASIAAVTVMVTAAAAAALLLRRMDATARPATSSTFTIPLEAPGYTVGPSITLGGAGSGTPAVSPDGTAIAFIAHNVTEATVWIRELSKLAPLQLPGTSGVRSVFWSPDGRSLGFFADGKLKTIEIASSRVEVLCDAPQGFGGTWAGETILFSPDERSPIYRISTQGGPPAQVTTLVAGRDEAHRWPRFLPDGQHFIYIPWQDGTTTRDVTLGSLDGSAPRALFQSQSGATPAGNYLLYVRDLPSRLMAWPFDMRTLQAGSKPLPVIADDNVDYNWYTGEPNASGNATTLSYTTGKYRRSQLTWVDRYGRTTGTVGEVGVYFDPILSSDGKRLALEKRDAGQGSGDVWTVDLARGAFTRVTSLPGYETTPVWSPDGSRVAYASDQSTTPHIYVNGASGGAESLLINSTARAFPMDWSPDGKYIVYWMNGGSTRGDLWIFDVRAQTMKPLLQTPFNEGWARLSPDGKWMAYTSDDSQRREVYVRSFPTGDVKVQISNAGGHEPQWRGDSRELFYIAPDDTIMAVTVRPQTNRFDADRPQPLFTAGIVSQDKTIRNQWAVSPDGQRFLLLSLIDRNASPIVSVLNWQSQLR